MDHSLRLIVLLSPFLLLSCGSPFPEEGSPSFDDMEGEEYLPYGQGKADSIQLPYEPLIFQRACEAGARVTIAAVGDVLLHSPLQKQAFADEQRYISLWSGVKNLLSAADITYANLEGPTASGVNKSGREVPDPGLFFDNQVYTSYPMFNYHPALVVDLKDSGVDVVSTANNHALDRWALGLDRTTQALEETGLAYTGTRRRGDARAWYTLTEANGFTIAWLAFTYGTNGIPDREGQVLYQDNGAAVLALVRELRQNAAVDAILVTPHWGLEYNANPNGAQVDLAHQLLDAGATAIIGSHPHVLQPWERYVTQDGRETFVIYSLGNFVSGQKQIARRSTLLLFIGLTRGGDGVVSLNGVRFVPLHMSNPPEGSYTVAPLEQLSGQTSAEASRSLINKMFHPYNLHQLSDPLDPAIQCIPGWTPPQGIGQTGWIGSPCQDLNQCGGAQCFPEYKDGLCSLPCDKLCPDRSGWSGTFCADLGHPDNGLCLTRCASENDCRAGYHCLETARFGEPTVSKKVCLPAF